MFLVDLDVLGSMLRSLGYSGHGWDIWGNSSSRCEVENTPYIIQAIANLSRRER
jgi:hypothetical protein